jgi:hypothetical protein
VCGGVGSWLLLYENTDHVLQFGVPFLPFVTPLKRITHVELSLKKVIELT